MQQIDVRYGYVHYFVFLTNEICRFVQINGTAHLTLSLTAPFAPPCLEALGLIGPRKKEKKTGFDDVS